MQRLPPDDCPSCGHRKLVPIAYSIPGRATAGAIARGELAFGGWVMWDGAPTMRCLACGHALGALRLAGAGQRAAHA